ncbi:ATP-binding protein [Streptomyces sp. SPB162]|uniref:ATP-binding protein n=1 Tax=Streptomyces sp. SPB162 TaxID=2940560 RepID=UPI00240748B2|nr:ATP-binding protein [Streptomyces sp. SPB162]MDF9813292.1 anti-sigma regulatory factor (Ser/Thr protein kinase) [Streptomyces sp. SPB162]
MATALAPETDAGLSYSLQLPNDPRSARVARVTLRAVLRAHRREGLADVAELLASELVGNALRYSDGVVTLRVHWREATLRLAVLDNSAAPPVCEAVEAAEAESGRGLALVRELAEDWGYYLVGEEILGVAGKLVWCDIATVAGDRTDPGAARR